MEMNVVDVKYRKVVMDRIAIVDSRCAHAACCYSAGRHRTIERDLSTFGICFVCHVIHRK
jgi:hypothetical protein